MSYGKNFQRQNKSQGRGNVLVWPEEASRGRQTAGLNLNQGGRPGFPNVFFNYNQPRHFVKYFSNLGV